MLRLKDLLRHYGDRPATDARRALISIADAYARRANGIGYVPLVGAATGSGLLGVLLLARDDAGVIDESKLPPDLVEAFKMQYPNVYEAGGLGSLTPESAESYLNGWSGKYTEILVRNALNSGGSIGGVSLKAGETAVLATNPTQSQWDIMVEPTGRLLQVKSTDSIAYVKETMEDLDGTGIDVISTDLPDFNVDSSVELMELAMSKDEIDAFIDNAILDSTETIELDDFLGVFALLFTAGTTVSLVKKVREDLKQGKRFHELYRVYGPRVIGKAINLASPIPFAGLAASWWLRGRVMLAEASETARERVARADKMLARMRAKELVTPDKRSSSAIEGIAEIGSPSQAVS
jgi:hypothetical protein